MVPVMFSPSLRMEVQYDWYHTHLFNGYILYVHVCVCVCVCVYVCVCVR